MGLLESEQHGRQSGSKFTKYKTLSFYLINYRLGRFIILQMNHGTTIFFFFNFIVASMMQEGVARGKMTQTYESAEKCLQTNYLGAKRMCEALIPLLQLSDSARIVNVSSSLGKLMVKQFYSPL